ncbi:MAG: hypothetical protein ACD_41C00102G0003 [uncultured bacterium]|nr:MAG: hypothetical protein ACD_41C00102G0003 [uncultured bacterium]HBY74235.1 hypothetical protein [Candidatus Kerfeldbacteria bacterium]
MKRLSIILLLAVGLMSIAALYWLVRNQPTTDTTDTNRPPTWTSDVENEIVIVPLDSATAGRYQVTLEPFGVLSFAAVGEMQTVAEHQVQLVSVTTVSAQVLVSPKRVE